MVLNWGFFQIYMEMKKYFIISLFISAFLGIKGYSQVEQSIFSTVPVVNGKVVFQQFIHTDQNLPDNQKYTLLAKWAKETFSGNPNLLGLRFDEKSKSINVSTKTDLGLSSNKLNINKAAMTYRFDATIINGGCNLVIREISYQAGSNSAVPAEQSITDNAVNSTTDTGSLNSAIRKGTLDYLNQLYAKLNKVFN